MSRVVEAARAYKGCPWRHQGRSRSGLDCAGLLVLAFRDAGVVLTDLSAYTRHPWKDGLEQVLAHNFQKVDSAPAPGDVLLFRYTRYPQHLALATDKGIIHSLSGGPGVVEHGLDSFWAKRLLGVYRL